MSSIPNFDTCCNRELSHATVTCNRTWLGALGRRGGSQVAWSIHTVMQDTNDRYAVRRDAKVKHVPLNISATIARPNVVTCRGYLGRLRQFGKGRRQGVDVTVGLLHAPLLSGMSPDRFKVALGGGGKAIFSHAGPASAP